jgi:hypothetical protein
MIWARAPGVESHNGQSFIRSFNDFYQFVAVRRPEVVANAEARNPFPGLLREPRYSHAKGNCTDVNSRLFWSEAVFGSPRPVFQFELTADGHYDAIPR